MPKVKKLKEPKQDDEWRGWLEELGRWQESDLDQRQKARESDRFLLDDDGQWEDDIRRQLDSQHRPRYTFDKITPVIESMMADIEDMDFGCNVKPGGSGASKDVALTYEGLIRAIQNNSRSDSTFRKSARRVMRRGFDAWLVKADYSDDWSFEQDLFITGIPNAINRVWVSDTCVEEDSSDTPAAYVLTSMSPADYEKQFPDGKAISISDADLDEHYDEYRPEVITIAERYYREETKTEVAQLSNGNVVELNEEFDKIKDEMTAAGVTIVRTKKVKGFKWWHCSFDGGGILTEPRETVFKSCPVVTVYGNHELLGQHNKITYSGIVMKEMDAQRVHNYAKSREIEEGALAPRAKWWMTKAQAQGHERQIGRMNISADPVQFYNHQDGVMPPQYSGGAQVNQHLSVVAQQMALDIKEQANVFSAMQGDFAGRMSEDTVKMQIDRGTASTRKWINPLITGIRRVCEILVETIPAVYDTQRQMMIMNEDGSEDEVVLNQEVFDVQTQTMVKVNDLNAGKYKVACDAGPAFANRLEAGLDALLNYAQIDPTIIQQGGDIMLKSIDAPLVDKLAERKRMALLQQGMIPPDQMTEEEQQQMMQQAQQPKEPDAAMVMAQAEMMKGQADMLEQQNKQAALQLEAAKVQQSGQKIALDAQAQQVDNMAKAADIDKTVADTALSWAKTEETSGKSTGQKIDNMQKVTPQVTILAQSGNPMTQQ